MDTVDEFLAHYGRKGMRWGVRAATRPAGSPEPVLVKTAPGKKIKTSGGSGHSPSDDAKAHAAKIQLARKSGLQSLSDKDLKALNSRIQMEQTFRKTVPKTPSQKAKKFVAEQLASVAKQEISFLSGASKNPGPITTLVNKKKAPPAPAGP
jgi:hypothetical protein